MKVYTIGLHEVKMYDPMEVEKYTIFLKYEAGLNEYHLPFYNTRKHQIMLLLGRFGL